MSCLTTSNTVKIRNLIEIFADAFNEKLKYSPIKNRSMGINAAGATIKYKDVEFLIEEHTSANPVTGQYLNSIIITPPRNMNVKSASVSWSDSYTMTGAIDARLRACRQLAEYFVEEILPKVDFEIDKALYDRNIDRILSVLD